jgi:ABC-2 type transport system ATP-binding protein
MNNQIVIETKNLTRAFNDILAVNQLNVSIAKGEVFGLLGPNGAGKTTVVRMLSALLEPTHGEATIAGYRLGEDDQNIRRKIGLLPEAPGLYDSLSAVQNLTFFGSMYGINDSSSRIQRYLEMLGLWNRRFEPVGTFSKGMRQKLALARALLHEPEILFLDEPTSGLDPQAARLVREFIGELKIEGRTIVICTHNLEEADRLCDRVAVIKSHLLALDTPGELRRKLFGRKVIFHLRKASQEMVELVRNYQFVHDVEIVDNKLVVSLDQPELNNPTIIKTLVENKAELQFVGELRRRLEDVYLELVQASQEDQNG